MGSDAFAAILGLLMRANLAAAAAIVAVLVLRLAVGRRFGARAAYALWTLVPLVVVAVLLPARRVQMLVTPAPAGEPPPVAAADLGEVARSALLPHLDVAALGLGVWAIGALGCLVALSLSQQAFRRALGRLRLEGGVFRAEAGGVGPVLLGVLRPRIVLPADFEAQFSADERAVVLAHEQAHLRNGDHLVNALSALAQCLCWFNPLVHLGAFHLRVDQELACDAAVMERHPESRRSYAQAMLKAQFSRAVTAPLACHWPGRGTHPLKRRIALLQEAPPSRVRRVAGLLVVAALAAGAGAAAWAAQPPKVDVVEAGSSQAVRGTAAGWNNERQAETQRAGLRLRRELTAGDARRLDGDLIDAALVGDGQATDRLLAAGADPNAKLMGDGSPLIVAAREGRLDIAQRLVAGGANVNGFVLFDETPLINAARAGQLPMVRFLLDHGADPNLAVPSGNAIGEMRSPLGMAADPRVAAYLKSRGARA